VRAVQVLGAHGADQALWTAVNLHGVPYAMISFPGEDQMLKPEPRAGATWPDDDGPWPPEVPVCRVTSTPSASGAST
jgi:hypothetical protein